MAYSATVTRRVDVVQGEKHVVFTVVETEAANSSEFELVGVPVIGTIVRYEATLIAGTGTTINPIVGRAAGFAANSQDHIGTNTTTAAHVHDQTALRYDSTSGSLFIRSTVNNATADHTVHTEVVVREGTS